MDELQDVELLSSAEDEVGTIITLVKQLNPTDPQDILLEVRVLYEVFR